MGGWVGVGVWLGVYVSCVGLGVVCEEYNIIHPYIYYSSANDKKAF